MMQMVTRCGVDGPKLLNENVLMSVTLSPGLYWMRYFLSNFSSFITESVYFKCEQELGRSRCTSAQSGQLLCYALGRW